MGGWGVQWLFGQCPNELLYLLAPQSGAHTIAPHRDPIQPNPIQSTYSSRAKNGQTEQDQNAGVRFTIQNCEFMNNLFRKNFCRTMKKFRNCIKKRCETSALKSK